VGIGKLALSHGSTRRRRPPVSLTLMEPHILSIQCAVDATHVNIRFCTPILSHSEDSVRVRIVEPTAI